MSRVFGVEYVTPGTHCVRLGDLVVTSTTRRRNSHPEIAVTRSGSVLLLRREDLADPQARRRLLRGAKRQGAVFPEAVLIALAAAPPSLNGPRDFGNAYRVTAEGMVYRRQKGVEIEEIRLSNFSAVITKEIINDDGHDTRRDYELRVTIGSETRDVRVAATQFHESRWMVETLGVKAIVTPGIGAADHLRVAIQSHSAPTQELVFGHTGWRQENGKKIYLHAGGAIGGAGLIPDARVHLPDALKGYLLPEPPQGTALADAIRGSLRFLDIVPDHISIPLLAAAYRAALGPADFWTSSGRSNRGL